MPSVSKACILAGDCDTTAPDFQRFDRLLGKVVEHTSGCDVQCYYGDNLNWTNTRFSHALADRTTRTNRTTQTPSLVAGGVAPPSLAFSSDQSTFRGDAGAGAGDGGQRLHNYQTAIDSWLEQRSYMPNALAALSTPAHKKFAEAVINAIEVLRKPPHPRPDAAGSGWQPVPLPHGSHTGAGAVTIHCGGGVTIDYSTVDGSVLNVVSAGNGGGVDAEEETPRTLWSGSMGSFMYVEIEIKKTLPTENLLPSGPYTIQ